MKIENILAWAIRLVTCCWKPQHTWANR